MPTLAVENVAGVPYDATSEQLVLNLKTQKGWSGTCRTGYLELSDGTVHTASFQFK